MFQQVEYLLMYYGFFMWLVNLMPPPVIFCPKNRPQEGHFLGLGLLRFLVLVYLIVCFAAMSYPSFPSL